MMNLGNVLLGIDKLKEVVAPALDYVQRADAAPRIAGALTRLIADSMVKELLARPVPQSFIDAIEAYERREIGHLPLYEAAIRTIGER